MVTVKLDEFRGEADELRKNRLLFDWLSDDDKRAELYAELGAAGFPVLRFKSVLREGGRAPWPSEDVYLVSSRQHVSTALQRYSVKPYAHLDSGGRFMLGLERGLAHTEQHNVALRALVFSRPEIEACIQIAVERALVLPLKDHRFDLVTDVAEQAALRFVALLFGLPAQAHVELGAAMGAAYARLTFQIIGRHFVSDTGLPPEDSERSQRIKRDIENFVREAATRNDAGLVKARGVPQETVIGRLRAHYGSAADEPVFVALGLMAGTIGNIKAAVAIAIDHFFRVTDGRDERLIDQATRAARQQDHAALGALIGQALAVKPPAPFLARTADGKSGIALDGDAAIPQGAHVLLALGAEANPKLMFGGNAHDALYPHRCVGEHLAWPLIHETVFRVLRLPGLSRVIDPDTGKACPLEKRWGASCEHLPLLYQRDRRLNQQPLFVVLPIKHPIAENAARLKRLTEAGAYIIEEALADSRHVHFAWFSFVEGGTHLAMSTVYDGDFDAYVEYFALQVPLFDEQFQYLDVDMPRPISQYPKEFVDVIRRYNRAPLGGYFFSAYPQVRTAEVRMTGLNKP
ncbi:hypothetical protein ACVNIS_00960 [Sphaerotilaceae bacterium SBD11-9]